MKETKIPKCMSTQHPDNVNQPFFAEDPQLSGEDEIQEAYYAFSHLACDEQMWDCEGKEVDDYVVKKLLTRYEGFFRNNRLGEDIFITLRVPNPTVEHDEAKILLETLESIPRSFDAAKLFYGDDIAPIFEVILPMTTSPKCVDRIYRYYADFVVGKQNMHFKKGDIPIRDWIGEFQPETINVIPLFEDMDTMLNAHEITRTYLQDKKLTHQRVFLARSDPSMNYGLVSAVLLNKIALKRLHKMSQETGVEIYPIMGVGSAPFRGNMRPDTVDKVANEHPSAHTFSIQSAFKYDNPHSEVVAAIKKLKQREKGTPRELDEERCIDIAQRYSEEYQKQVEVLAPMIIELAKYVPTRRKRKLHIGLFGYQRSMRGISLPRVITFTAALYSVGLPPEILGLNALTKDDISFLKSTYLNCTDDLKDALQYLNPDSPYLTKELAGVIEAFPIDFEVDKQHKEITDNILKSLAGDKAWLEERVLRAANIRRFLG